MELREVTRAPALAVPERYRTLTPIGLGFCGWFVALGAYKLGGFSPPIAVLFGASILAVGWGIHRQAADIRIWPSVTSADVLSISLLVALFAPLYLIELYRLPYPVHNDEIRLMVLETKLTQPGTDWFGISEYLTMPTFLFSLFGTLGKALGGIDLTNMRAVHAGMGVLTILVSYLLFRSAAGPRIAFGGASILGINHSLWMLSRMALWDNSALLFEVIALAFLMHALRRKSPGLVFLGGVAAGMCFYVYLPARATVLIWGLLMLALVFYFRSRWSRRSLLALSGSSLAGFLLVITPLFLTNTNQTGKFSTEYRFLITPAGLEQQRLHAIGASGRAQMSTLQGYLFNVEHGLTAFNNFEWDNGGMYTNPDHGFVDPLTGILLWIGLGSVAWGWRAGIRPRAGEVLAVVGFVSLWLAFAFLINQAPNYTRMLPVLPFVAYLAAKGLDWLSTAPRRIIGERIELLSFSLRSTLFVLGLLTVGLLNLAIVGEYITFAWEDGSIRGATARYVEARAGIQGYYYHLYADQEQRYFVWGEELEWREWINFFLGEEQQLEVEPPQACSDLGMNFPFTVFMASSVWEQCGPLLVDEFPEAEVRYMQPNGSRVAVEVLDD